MLVYQGKGTGPDNFITYDHNWNLVCNGGLIVGALAVAETDPDVAKIIITGAVKSLPLALKSYGPDGAWPEGPAYWNYGTEHVVYGLAALESALGTDFGLSEMKGLSETGLFPIIVTGPTGLLNFELDALGVRWVRDLGRENYNLPEIWDFYYLTKKLGGKHFNYYRIGSFSHNIPVLNGINQDELAKAKFLKYESGNSLSFVTIDLTEAYAPLSGKTIRGVAVVGERRAVLVQDEFEIEKSCDIAWGITTDADIKLDGNEALLMLKGKELTARIL